MQALLKASFGRPNEERKFGQIGIRKPFLFFSFSPLLPKRKSSMPILGRRSRIFFHSASCVLKNTFHFGHSCHKQEVTWNYVAASISCGIDFQCSQAGKTKTKTKNNWRVDQWFKTWWAFSIRESGNVNFKTVRSPHNNSVSLTHASFPACLFQRNICRHLGETGRPDQGQKKWSQCKNCQSEIKNISQI